MVLLLDQVIRTKRVWKQLLKRERSLHALLIGGVGQGVGQALLEHSIYDPSFINSLISLTPSANSVNVKTLFLAVGNIF